MVDRPSLESYIARWRRYGKKQRMCIIDATRVIYAWQNPGIIIIPGGPKKPEQSIFQDFVLNNDYLFFPPCWIEHLCLIIITPRSSNLVENFLSWVISYGLSFSGFARFPEFRGTINDSFSSTCANTYQHSTSYKEISVPMTCLDCKSLLGNTRITEHNTRSIYGRLKLSFIVPRNTGNRANPENDSP